MSAKRPFVPVRTAAGTIYRIQTGPRRPQETKPTVLAMTIGRNIGDLRKHQGMTQQELGAAVGCDRSAVCRWESGDRLPSLPHLVALGRALGCTARALLPEE